MKIENTSQRQYDLNLQREKGGLVTHSVPPRTKDEAGTAVNGTAEIPDVDWDALVKTDFVKVIMANGDIIVSGAKPAPAGDHAKEAHKK